MFNFLLDFTIRSRSRTILAAPAPGFLERLQLQLQLLVSQPAPAPRSKKHPPPAPQPRFLQFINDQHFRNKSIEDYACGEPGDLYSWNATSWKEAARNAAIPTNYKLKEQICYNKEVLKLPGLTFRKIYQCYKIYDLPKILK